MEDELLITSDIAPIVSFVQIIEKTDKRALVLGGGGATGNAWLIGLIAGLLDGGLNVTQANLIIGTSAGSTTAAQITSITPCRTICFRLNCCTDSTERIRPRISPN